MEILTDPALLRVNCSDVLPEEVDSLRFLLEKALLESESKGQPGIGLAAPQIGIAKKMAIVRIPNNSGVYKVDLVNCKIASGYNKMVVQGEGCLSFPGRYEQTLRYEEIYVVDNLIKPYSFIATGLVAVCIQHELDHLQGVLLSDVAIGSRK